MSRIQWNATSGKNFRDTLGKYHNAQHQLADTLLKLQADKKSNVESLASMEETLASDNATIDKADIERTIATLKAVGEKIDKDITRAREKSAKACEKALALVTDDLYNAYVDYAKAKGEKSTDDFAQAIATWLIANGFVDATADACKGFAGLVGLKRNSNRGKCKNGTLMAVQVRKVFEPTFIGALADNLQDAGIINAYKYNFELTSKKSNK